MQQPNIDQSPDVYRSCAEEALGVILSEMDTFDPRSKMALLGHIAVTRFHLGDPKTAHKTLEDPLLQRDPDERFRAWQYLAAQGDEASIPTARAAMAESSEQLNFVEDIIEFAPDGLRSAEKLVSLTLAGDTEMLSLARKAANGVYLKKRSDLLSILYRIGDQESLDLALQAIEDARIADSLATDQLKQAAKARGDDNYQYMRYTQNSTWSEMNLDEMFDYALKQGKVEDARKVLGHYGAGKRYDCLLSMYAAGITDVYGEIVSTRRDDLRKLNPTTIALARGGDQRSQIIVRSSVRKQERKLVKGKLAAPEDQSPQTWDQARRNEQLRRNLYKGLAALHVIGDGGISQRALRCVEHDDEFRSHDLSIFDDTDMDTTELYRAVYNRSPEGFRDTVIFTIGFSRELFSDKLREGIQRVKENKHEATNEVGHLMAHTAWLAKTAQ